MCYDFKKHQKTALCHPLTLTMRNSTEDEFGFSPAPLQGRQQLHVTRSVGFTLFVVSCLTSDTPSLKTNPHLWVSFAAETQSAPIKHSMLFSPLAVCFFPPATSDYWQLEQSRFCRAPSLELEKQSVPSPGRSSAPHREAPNTHRWTWARLIPRLLSPLCSCCILQRAWTRAWRRRRRAQRH